MGIGGKWHSCSFLLICTLFSDAGINQTFPSDFTYSCTCPCLDLSCTFPEGAIDVVWSFPGVASIYNEAGHRIDNSMRSRGMSILSINDSFYLKKSYTCIAVYNFTFSLEYQKNSSEVAGSPHTIPTYLSIHSATSFLCICLQHIHEHTSIHCRLQGLDIDNCKNTYFPGLFSRYGHDVHSKPSEFYLN